MSPFKCVAVTAGCTSQAGSFPELGVQLRVKEDVQCVEAR
jgi:hypothetical protein